MARVRCSKPEQPKNEELAKCSIEAAYLFAFLPHHADREGRLEDRPMRIKLEIFPYRDANVDALLDELANAKDRKGIPLIARYEVNGEAYIQIVKFTKHQNPHVKEAASTIPAQCLHDTSTVLALVEPGGNGNGIRETTSLVGPKPPRVKVSAEMEAEFKAAYPRRKGDQNWPQTWMRLEKALNAKTGWTEIVAGAARYAAMLESIGKTGSEFVKQAATWANQKGWLDDIEQPSWNGQFKRNNPAKDAGHKGAH